MEEKIKEFTSLGEYITYKNKMKMALKDWREAGVSLENGNVIVKWVKVIKCSEN